MAIWFSHSAKLELKSFSVENQTKVSEAIELLNIDSYREQNKIDLCLVEQGFAIWGLVVGEAWIAFHNDNASDICVDWVSTRSRFRPF